MRDHAIRAVCYCWCSPHLSSFLSCLLMLQVLLPLHACILCSQVPQSVGVQLIAKSTTPSTIRACAPYPSPGHPQVCISALACAVHRPVSRRQGGHPGSLWRLAMVPAQLLGMLPAQSQGCRTILGSTTASSMSSCSACGTAATSSSASWIRTPPAWRCTAHSSSHLVLQMFQGHLGPGR